MSSSVPMRRDGIALGDVVGMVARGPVHVRLERARRDRGDVDVVLDQPGRHPPRQMDHRRPCSRHRNRSRRGLTKMPSIEAMLMTLAGRSCARRRAQRLGQRLGQEEQRLDVEVHHLVPAAFREFVELRAPCGAGIVDEDVEFRLALDDFGGELVAAVHGRNVDRQRDAFAAIFGRELLRGGLAGAGLARGDVDLRRALAEESAARSSCRCRAIRPSPARRGP